MTKQERQFAIYQYLQDKGELHVQNICRTFHVVEMTVRRDLKELEDQGLLIRTHGGAIAKEKKTYDVQTPLLKRMKVQFDEKMRIAQCASQFLSPNDTVFIGSGSTVDMFAQTLFHQIPLTIVTDAINIVYHLYQDPHLHIYMIGGEVRSNSLTLTGPIAQENLKQFQLKKAFISVNGIDEKGQLYTSSVVESALLEILFQNVDQVYVLCDHTKLRKKDLIVIQHRLPYILITDDLSDLELLESYKAKDIDVVQAGDLIQEIVKR